MSTVNNQSNPPRGRELEYLRRIVQWGGIAVAVILSAQAWLSRMDGWGWIVLACLCYIFLVLRMMYSDSRWNRFVCLPLFFLAIAIAHLGLVNAGMLLHTALLCAVLRPGKVRVWRIGFLFVGGYVLGSMTADVNKGHAYFMQILYQGGGLIFSTSIMNVLRGLLDDRNDQDEKVQRLIEHNHHTQRRALVDELTGLYNYRAYKEYVRTMQGYVICIIDIDRFKRLNDTYGHGTGNVVLRRLAGLIRQCIRQQDVAFRFGGEEFVIILPGANEELGLRVAERMRLLVAGYDFETPPGVGAVTVSVGLAVHGSGNSCDQVFEQADQALYQAKRAGRNRCKIFNSQGNKGPDEEKSKTDGWKGLGR